jgi:2-polyprenyl-3-methyl-5-hydroxy-6-metoxy-1,4-benzoquinol methylase
MTDVRFGFGENWRRFLELLDDERIAEVERSLTEWLGEGSLEGKTFLDAGCGSGLFSLAALRLGARRVHSFDYDQDSVGCALELRRRYGGDDGTWTVERGDVLDEAYIDRLGTYDVVYSWGVLHHTGDMWRALHIIHRAVAPGGQLFIAIYNDQRMVSRYWTAVKRIFNRLPPILRAPYAIAVMAPRELVSLAVQTLRGRPQDYLHSWTRYQAARGMSRWHDLLDWVGGYPFEVATPEEIFAFYHARGYQLERLRTCGGGLGCNEFVFRRAPPAGEPLAPSSA